MHVEYKILTVYLTVQEDKGAVALDQQHRHVNLVHGLEMLDQMDPHHSQEGDSLCRLGQNAVVVDQSFRLCYASFEYGVHQFVGRRCR